MPRDWDHCRSPPLVAEGGKDFLLFLNRLYFLDQFLVHSTSGAEGTETSPPTLPSRAQPPPLAASYTTQNGSCVRMKEPTQTHHYHPKSIVYIRVHSWGCSFYGFSQMCHGVPRNSFTALANLRSLHIEPSLPAKPWQPLIFLVSPSFCLFQNVIQLETQSMHHFQVGFFHVVIGLSGWMFLSVSMSLLRESMCDREKEVGGAGVLGEVAES